MKKIFLALTMIFMLVCLFAISVGAEATFYDDAPTRANIQVLKEDVIVFDDGFSCLSAYAFKDKASIDNGSHSTSGLAKALDFSYINGKTGKNYTIANVVSVDIPEGITTVGTFVGYGLKNLKRITFPYSVTSVGGVGFQNASSLEECIFEKGGNPAFTEINQYMFSNCTSLKWFSMPDSVTRLTGEGSHFGKCINLTAVHLSNSLETINYSKGEFAFDGCGKMYLVNEFFTDDSIPEKPTVYYFPESYADLTSGGCVFRGCGNLNDVLVFGEATTEVSNKYYFQHSPANTVVFLGDMTNVDCSEWGTSIVYFANEADKSASDIATLKGSKTKYYCYAEGNTNHLVEKSVTEGARCEVDEATVLYCFCGQEISRNVVEGTALSHDYDYINNEKAILVGITYSNYAQKGEKIVLCANCGVETKFEAPMLFNCLGYSAFEFGDGGIAIGFLVNKEAVAEYEKATGKTISYGVFVVSQVKLGENDIFANDGTKADGVISAEIKNHEFVAFELKLIGFATAQKSQKLAMGAYVQLLDGNTKEYSYIQSDSKGKKEGKYYFVSHNDIAPPKSLN